MASHNRPPAATLGIAGTAIALAALAACSVSSSPRAGSLPSSAAATAGSIAPDSATATSTPATTAVTSTTSGLGDRSVTAVFTPSGRVSSTGLAEAVLLLQARAALIPGPAVTVTAANGSITVVGGRDQLAAIKDLGRKVAVSFRPVLATTPPAGPTLPVPSAGNEDAAETAFTAAKCADFGTLPATPAAPDQYGIACSTDRATKYLLGPAGVAGSDVSSAKAINGTAGWEVDVTLNSRGTAAMTSLTLALSQDGGTMALVWDSTVATALRIESPVAGGAAQISGLSGLDQAQQVFGQDPEQCHQLL